ncbi:MAG: protein kinase [Hormoscilla sp. GUM202]|nr:protein kinase [Hormoscilla sp. GUM202]
MPINCPVCLAENADTAITCAACGCPLTSVQSHSNGYQLPAGTLLQGGRYRISRTIGEGGFGITYQGTDTVKSAEVAIKELCPDKFLRQDNSIIWPASVTPQAQQEQINKFKTEAECLQKCIHPHIVRVYDWFAENNTGYIVMEFIRGKQLTEILKSAGPLPEARVKQYFLQVIAALKVVHANNLIHRDIKPENIIIDEQDRAILIDFGTAREFIAGRTNQMTAMLTPGYAPVEQYTYQARRSPSTDFYAVCASMYHAITDRVPLESLSRMGSDDLIPPRHIIPSIHPQIEKIILTGMNMQADDRFQTADELIDALQGKFISPSLRKARYLLGQGKLKESAEAYEKCLAQEPDNGAAAVELALVLIYIDDDRAAGAARRAIQLQPNDSRGYGVWGLVNCRQGNWTAAVQPLQQAASLAPQESWIQANLAWALAKTGNWQQAEIAVDRALQLDSNATFALGLKAWIAVHQGIWKVAIRAARQAITKSKQTNSNSRKALQSWVYPCLTIALEKALLNQQAPDLDRCMQEYQTQVPDNAFVEGFSGWQAASLGKWTEAVSSFQQAMAKPRSPAWVYLNYGIVCEQLDNLPAAMQAYTDYIQKFGDDPLVLFRKGTLHARQGKWEQARSDLETAVQLKPDYAEAYHNLGWVLLQLRNPDGHVLNLREIRSAYHRAAQLYAQQQKHALSQAIKQAFQLIGVDL